MNICIYVSIVGFKNEITGVFVVEFENQIILAAAIYMSKKLAPINCKCSTYI